MENRLKRLKSGRCLKHREGLCSSLEKGQGLSQLRQRYKEQGTWKVGVEAGGWRADNWTGRKNTGFHELAGPEAMPPSAVF